MGGDSPPGTLSVLIQYYQFKIFLSSISCNYWRPPGEGGYMPLRSENPAAKLGFPRFLDGNGTIFSARVNTLAVGVYANSAVHLNPLKN